LFKELTILKQITSTGLMQENFMIMLESLTFLDSFHHQQKVLTTD